MKFLRFLLVFSCVLLFAQNGGFEIKNADKTTINFKLINNLILIPVKINNVDLTFLLDTGVSETILFSLDNKEINFNNVEKMHFTGLGENTQVEGLVSEKNKVSVGDNFVDDKHTIYIILDEDFNFSSNVGVPVNGIIGYHFFKNHKVKIDYIKKKITIYNSEKSFNKEKRRYEEVPISIEGKRPFVIAGVQLTKEQNPSKLLIDIGNSDAIWLFPALIKDFVYNRPNIDDFLGRGFNGDIYGKRSRMHNLYIGNFILQKPLLVMPDEYSIQHLKLEEDRKGSIGNEAMRRFNVIFNYPEEKIYLRKNADFNDPFSFNMSGIDVKNDGMIWEKDMVKIDKPKTVSNSTNETPVYSATDEFQYKFSLKPLYSVAGCRKDSPAYEAGVRKDDKIISINNKPTKEMSLERIGSIFKEKEGENIKIEVERDGKKLNFEFYLKDPIPYEEN